MDFFSFGLLQVTRGGFYLLNLMDNFVGGINLLILGVVEIVTIIYIYGYDHFAQDIELMLGKKPNIYWQVGSHLRMSIRNFSTGRSSFDN